MTPLEAAQAEEIARLQRDCAEAYQIVGALALTLSAAQAMVNHALLARLLDNLLAAAEEQPRPHDDLLPFSLIAEPD